jgi:demethylmenaquinone methyltransferase/2-methoxy-6-polyprenyl-1,4-benzoquinol methylase
MFSRIVSHYDLLNDLMTAGMHRHWKRLAAQAAEPGGAFVLDLGTGTADIARELVRRGARSVVAGDFVAEMLEEAERSARRHGIRAIQFVQADATDLPFADGVFDCVTSGFLVRNVVDPDLAFLEMHRVLRPGGRVVCLEATRRDDRIGRLLSGAFGVVARVLGRFVAGDAPAYSYLPDSAAGFASPEELATIIQRAGFERVQWRRLGFGLIAIHRARKALHEPVLEHSSPSVLIQVEA